MTFTEMKTDVWEQIGKPSDIDPDTYTTIGKWINRAYKRILLWKFPDGHLIRFRAARGILNFVTKTKSGTATAGTTSTITLASGVGTDDDQYNGWVVEIYGGTGSGQKRLISDYAGASRTATVSDDWDTTPDATSTYYLYKNFMKIVSSSHSWASEHLILDPVNSMYSILRVTDLEDEVDLSPADRTATFSKNLTSEAVPSQYLLFGDTLYFDTPMNETRWYEIEYVRFPGDLVNATDEPEIPDPWHEAIVLWAVWWGLRRMQEYAGAYSTRKELENFMETTAEQMEMEMERENSYAVVDFGE